MRWSEVVSFSPARSKGSSIPRSVCGSPALGSVVRLHSKVCALRHAPLPALPLRPCFYRYASRGVMHLLHSLLNLILRHHSPSGAARVHHDKRLCDLCFGVRQPTGSGQRKAAPSRTRTGVLWEIDMLEMFERQ